MADRRRRREDKREREYRERRDEEYKKSRHEREERSRESPSRRERRRERSRSPNERYKDDRHSRRDEDDRHSRRDEGRDTKKTSQRERRDEREHGEGRDHHHHKDQSSSSKSHATGDKGSPHKPWFDSKDLKKAADSTEPAPKKSEPDFGVSGKLAAETNTLNGVLIKYSEPPEARVPKTRWRFYEFKGDDFQNTLHLHRQSAYLIGRDRKIVDFPIDHPSCSKQHAVLQYRLVDYEKEDGRKGKKVKPYIIDLESTNGTHVNGERIDNRRFVELKEKDVVKFGFSTREYVLLHENSKGSEDAMSPDPATTTP